MDGKQAITDLLQGLIDNKILLIATDKGLKVPKLEVSTKGKGKGEIVLFMLEI